VHLALKENLTVIPVLNKIDLPSADPETIMDELENVLAIPREEVILASAKDGTGVVDILEAIVARIPAPKGDPHAPVQGLIFDSHYDAYKGVIVYVRLAAGTLRSTEPVKLMASGALAEPLELGVFRPQLVPVKQLVAGEVGYVATGLKNVREAQVGDTLTTQARPASEPLPGYQEAKSLVFAGIYPLSGEDYPLLREALDKLHLNDASFTFEPESSVALGFAFRCGFLGMLHMEIVQERLEREHSLDLIASAPSVEYHVQLQHGRGVVVVDNPAMLPGPSDIESIEEPWVKLSVVTPSAYIGALMELSTNRRGTFVNMEYLDPTRVVLHFEMPLAELIVDYFDQLKSRSQGYASMDYEELGYRPANLAKVDILVNGEPVDALSIIVHRDRAQNTGRQLAERLKQLIPRQMFEIPIQAAIGSNVIARETVRAMRKNVLAKCYGGDISRKRKLLEKQKEGKQRMKRVGSVEIPQEAFLAMLRLDEG
jgi:GTP-binding protein LepA